MNLYENENLPADKSAPTSTSGVSTFEDPPNPRENPPLDFASVSTEGTSASADPPKPPPREKPPLDFAPVSTSGVSTFADPPKPRPPRENPPPDLASVPASRRRSKDLLLLVLCMLEKEKQFGGEDVEIDYGCEISLALHKDKR